MHKFNIFITFLIIPLFFSRPAEAFDEINTGYFDSSAVGGYDVVNYFTTGTALLGLEDYKTTWNSADWLFSTPENLALFKATPEAYAPQYGGYCSNQMSLGNLSDIDPNVWKMVDRKLYFFGHVEGKDRWEHETLKRISEANKNWHRYLATK